MVDCSRWGDPRAWSRRNEGILPSNEDKMSWVPVALFLCPGNGKCVFVT